MKKMLLPLLMLLGCKHSGNITSTNTTIKNENVMWYSKVATEKDFMKVRQICREPAMKQHEEDMRAKVFTVCMMMAGWNLVELPE